MKKVVHLIPYDGIGGVERAARSMGNLPPGALEFKVDWIYRRITPGSGNLATFNPLPMLDAARRIYMHPPDLLIVSLWRACVVAALVKLVRPRLKLILFLHLPADVHWLDRIFTRRAARLACQVWADSSETLARRLPGGSTRGRVISFVVHRIPALENPAVEPVFIFWGRINRQKGLDRALGIFSAVHAEYPEARFLIVGPDGGDLARIDGLVRAMNLQHSVRFLGGMDFDEIRRLARAASFYLQTSLLEGMAMSVVEAMQLGLVPVVTPVGEIGNYCRHRDNALVVDADAAAVDDILAVLRDATTYLALRRNAVATWLGKPLYGESVIEACEAVLAGAPENPAAQPASNFDPRTLASFGDEWQRLDQSGMDDHESGGIFGEYFSVFPWSALPPHAEGFDMGCGSGRWARWVAPRVGRLHCIDPSAAIEVARAKLAAHANVAFHRQSLDAPGLPPGSQDFGYSLGVLHHVPDTAVAIRSCVELLKPGAPLLLYIYYAFEGRPWWFPVLWRVADWGRKLIFRLPPGPKYAVTAAIAALVYWPLARLSKLLERLGLPVQSVPLSYYRHHSFYTMRTDARDRFGTPVEKRFSRAQIAAMMESAGLVDLRFSDAAPFWCVVGKRGAV